jgi:hypothetical protein
MDICCALALAEFTLEAEGRGQEAKQIGRVFDLAESTLFA